jgi:uncharacterized protein (TIGR03118 family)
MTANLLRNFMRNLTEARQVHYVTCENQPDAERTELNTIRYRIIRNYITGSKNGVRNSFSISLQHMIVVFSVLAIVSSGCKKLQNELQNELPGKIINPVNYVQTNLVSDTVSNNAARLDSTLSNAWGVAINPAGIFWINVNGTDGSEIYDKTGVAKRPPVKVPAPSGIVFNATTDFMITASSQVPKFIFASENGKIYAWASGDTARTVADRSAGGSVYKGLELANDGTANFLFATDFHNGKIDVFDKNYNLVASKPFMDPMIPAGFAPFNIRLIDSVLYVTYAKQLGPENKDDEKGAGNGYVNIFNTSGSLVKRFASQGKLNSPWGIEKAPEGFGQGKRVILIGNFGDGHINVYEEGEGEFLRPLTNYGKPVWIDGLWAITFPDNNVPGDDPNKLYFTAGPNDEGHGLFGYLTKQ